MSFTCLYQGPPDECSECGGYDDTGTGLCSDECHASRAARLRRMEADDAARRAADDAYGAEVDRLHTAGHDYDEIDLMLKGMP